MLFQQGNLLCVDANMYLYATQAYKHTQKYKYKKVEPV